jgi:hypothetical protein
MPISVFLLVPLAEGSIVKKEVICCGVESDLVGG